METTLSFYQDRIRTALAMSGHLGVSARHVEAFMRIEHPTLDHLSPQRFDDEVRIAAECVLAAGADQAEALAQSYGL